MNLIKSFYFLSIFISLIFSNSEQKLNETISYILNGNYIKKNQYLDNSNNESYYYNNIYTLTNNDNVKNDFLKGLIEIDGEKSKEYFKNYYLNFPEDDYADDSALKVAEFYYSSGLYIKSSDWYKKIALDYPQSDYFETSVSYFLNSLIIAGYKDTANFYIKKLKNKHPKLKFSNEYMFENSIKNNPKKQTRLYNNNNKSKYSVQIGSYKNYDSAKSKKNILSNEGFLCRIDEILVNGEVFYSLRIGIFGTQELAKKEQKRLISRIGLYDSIIIELK